MTAEEKLLERAAAAETKLAELERILRILVQETDKMINDREYYAERADATIVTLRQQLAERDEQLARASEPACLYGCEMTDGIHHDEQFHQVLIRRRAGGLHDEDVAAANVLVDLDESFAVREGREFGGAKLRVEVFGDGLCESGVSRAAQNLQTFIHGARS